VRPERLELPTYWFEAIDETAINDLDGVRQREVEEYYQSVSLMGVALRITPSVQVVGIPVGIPGTKALHSGGLLSRSTEVAKLRHNHVTIAVEGSYFQSGREGGDSFRSREKLPGRDCCGR
jgi:hypothetical protein